MYKTRWSIFGFEYILQIVETITVIAFGLIRVVSLKFRPQTILQNDYG